MTDGGPLAGTFDRGWSAFNQWVSARARAEGKSSMWQEYIADFDLHRGRIGLPADLRAFAFNASWFRHYGFLEQHRVPSRYPVRQAMLRLNDFVVRALKVLRTVAWNRNLGGFGKTELTGHPAFARELMRRGLWAGFVEFCRRHRLAPAGYNAMKSYYAASVVSEAIGATKPVSVLEIGGGVGTLASVLLDRHDVARYCIVDLPEMILNSSIALRALYPDLPIHFMYPGGASELPPGRGVFCFVPEAAHLLPSSSCDVAVNIDSFQEMTRAQVAGYVTLAQRVVRDGGAFVNLNRRKFLGPERFDNNPLMYPYVAGNIVRRWEVDDYMNRTLNLGGSRSDSWVLRVESVVKQPA